MTSKNTAVREDLNLAAKRAKPNHGGPASIEPNSQEVVAINQKPKQQTAQDKKQTKTASTTTSTDPANSTESCGRKRMKSQAIAPQPKR